MRIFQSSYVGIKSDLFSGAAFKVLFNTGFLLGLGTFFTAFLVTCGYRINRLRLRLEDTHPLIQFMLFLGL
ncbi:MAG: hypothetical protein Q8O99_03030 [bacterium]|nr:hypothetical protein [bacterium]